MGYEAANLPQDLQNSQIKLQMQRRQYEAFIKDMRANGFPLKPYPERTQVHKFSHSEATSAVHGAQRHHSKWLGDIGADTSPLDTPKKYHEAKFSGSRDYQVLMDYNKRINKEELSALAGLELYKNTLSKAEKMFIGLPAADGTVIESVNAHFIARVIGNYKIKPDGTAKKREGVSLADVKDTLLAPKDKRAHTHKSGDRRMTFYGRRCDVTISIDDCIIIQTNPA